MPSLVKELVPVTFFYSEGLDLERDTECFAGNVSGKVVLFQTTPSRRSPTLIVDVTKG